MLERLRGALISSFIGAITLGWVFAQAILHFAYIFSAPVAGWLTRREYHEISDRVSPGFFLHDSVPEIAKSVSLFLIGYVLLRWLYYGSSQHRTARADHGSTV